jgi:hypothetical protein
MDLVACFTHDAESALAAGCEVTMVMNPCGYGNFDGDRSSPMVGVDDRLLEAFLRAIPKTLEREALEPSEIDWIKFNSQYAIKEQHNSIGLSPVADLGALPRSFGSMEITAFGRSIGAFLASCHTIRQKIYYTPFQSIEKIELRPSQTMRTTKPS